MKWHDGSPITSEDIAAGLNLYAIPELGGYAYNRGLDVKEARAVDARTVEVSTNEATPIFLTVASLASMVKPSQSAEERASERVIGSGPFKLVNWQGGTSITLEAFEDYYRGPASVAGVELFLRGEPAVRTAMVATGEVDLALDIGIDNLDMAPRIATGGTAEVVSMKVNTLWHPILKDKRARHAVAYAIDCEKIVNTIWKGATQCRGLPLDESAPGLNVPELQKPHPYDPAKARQLLQEVGYNDEVVVLMARPARIPKGPEIWEAVVGMLKEAGFNAKLSLQEPTVWAQYHRGGSAPAWRENPSLDYVQANPGFPWQEAGLHTSPYGGDYSDLQSIISYMSCDGGSSWYCDPDLMPKIVAAKAASGAERATRMEELARVWHDELPVIPLFDQTMIYGLAADIDWTPRFDGRIELYSAKFK